MLVFGFWLPPLLVGWFFAHRCSPAWISLLTAVLWPLLWLLIILSLIPTYSPGDSPDASGMLAASAITFASVVSLVSAIACSIGA
jgi:hypothetical protein